MTLAKNKKNLVLLPALLIVATAFAQKKTVHIDPALKKSMDSIGKEDARYRTLAMNLDNGSRDSLALM